MRNVTFVLNPTQINNIVRTTKSCGMCPACHDGCDCIDPFTDCWIDLSPTVRVPCAYSELKGKYLGWTTDANISLLETAGVEYELED